MCRYDVIFGKLDESGFSCLFRTRGCGPSRIRDSSSIFQGSKKLRKIAAPSWNVLSAFYQPEALVHRLYASSALKGTRLRLFTGKIIVENVSLKIVAEYSRASPRWNHALRFKRSRRGETIVQIVSVFVRWIERDFIFRSSFLLAFYFM